MKHGLRKTKLYTVWSHMKDRCNNPRKDTYPYYGGRGIKVCAEWINNFKAFYDWSMANGYKEGLTLDRINTDGDYEPNNCRWITTKEQANNRRSNRYITFNGESHTLAEWSVITGISDYNIWQRIERLHWSIEKALTTPVKNVRG